MTKIILILIGKLIIGMFVIFTIFFIIIKLCKYIREFCGELYGFLSLIIFAVIIGFVSNKIYKRRIREFTEVNREKENILNEK